MARLAATTTAAFVRDVPQAGDTEHEVALRFAALAERLMPALRPILVGRVQRPPARERSPRHTRSRRAAKRASSPTRWRSLSASPTWSASRGSVARSSCRSSAASRVRLPSWPATCSPPVRLIKTIGDAAMFVSPEPGPLVAAALALVEASRPPSLPSLRAGDGLRPALLRSGDFYGHAVNLASRVTGVARPGSVLCTRGGPRRRPESEFDWSFAGRHRFKGVAEPVPLYRARRQPTGCRGRSAGRRSYEPPAGRPRRRASS